MSKKSVVMFLSNPYRPDARVEREALSLGHAGYQVTIIAWDRKSEFAAEEILTKGVNVKRIQNVRSTYGAGLIQLIYLPLFWQAAVRQTEMIHPDIVHCHDLDTLYAGVLYQKRTGVKLIYDAHENYPAMMTLYLPGIITNWLERFERKIAWNADALIAASREMAVVLREMTDAPVEVIGNYPTRSAYSQVTKAHIEAKREKLNIERDDLVIGYIGGFTKNRVIMPLIEAVSTMADVRLIIVGDGIQRKEIEHRIRNSSNILYLGWISSEQVPLITSVCDILYYVLEPHYPGAIFNAPNSLANAMAAGKPIIANRVGDLGFIVEENQCGVLLDRITPTHIREAIQKLRDKSLREELGMAGRTAYERQYNWDHAQSKLIKLYEYVDQLK